MRFLRMFTNALLAGGLCAAYLTILVLQLNPDLPLLSATSARWFLALALTYGLHLAVAFYGLLVVRELFSVRGLSPGWASVRVLAWLSAGSAAIAATLMWLNAAAYREAIGEIAARRLIAGSVAVAASAVVLGGIALVHYSYGRRGGRVGGALFALAASGSVLLPLAARGPAVSPGEPVRLIGAAPPAAGEPSAPRILMLLLDGASLEYIRTSSTDGRLPNLARVLDGGASMYLATFRPTQPAPVWAAVATGMYPAKNGVRSAARYYAWGGGRPAALLPAYCLSQVLVRVGMVREMPSTSAAWHARPLWSILSSAGISTGIVRWPLTYPAQALTGFMVTDRFDELERTAVPYDPRAAYPADTLTGIRLALEEEPPETAAHGPHLAAATRLDRVYSRIMRRLRAGRNPRVAAVRFRAIDAAGHWHFEANEAAPFRGHDDGASRANAQQVERAYEQIDAEVGAALQGQSPGDLLLVLSGFGMEHVHPLRSLQARVFGDPVFRGAHERAPDGFLLAYGDAVQPGRLPPGSIVDLTPTVLYFLGVPVGRDMDGFARTDLFTPDFTLDRPIAFIGSHNW